VPRDIQLIGGYFVPKRYEQVTRTVTALDAEGFTGELSSTIPHPNPIGNFER
jgi:hypothetical protein